MVIYIFTSSALGRDVLNFNKNWKFSKGYHPNAVLVQFDDSDWINVRLPHDWAISGPFEPKAEGSTGKLPWRGEGWYRKKFRLQDSYEGKQVYIIFDGVMAFPKVYINGELAGEWDYGYNSFYLNITHLVNFGKENTIAVHADTRKHESRWYPGAGIYRKVQMIVVDPVHVDIWGTYVTTPEITKNKAVIRVKTTINNLSVKQEKIELISEIMSPESQLVERTSAFCVINNGEYHTYDQKLIVNNPTLWDIENPKLYKVITTVKVNDQIRDTYKTYFGIRTFEFTGDDGFHLNGRRIRIKGVNLHHGHGPLGAAFHRRAMERQIEIMKEMGCNAIRSSHNVPDPELPELCDRIGMLLFDEAFDKWDKKADILPETDFRVFSERQLKNFIKRDRNHPSVVIWSVGNEIPDIMSNKNKATYRLETMIEMVRKYDLTRPVTMVTSNAASLKYRQFDMYDVHCWNYGRKYHKPHSLAPEKAAIISESASTVSTRGYYDLELPKEKTDFNYESGQVSSYDLNAPRWAEVPDDDFMWYEEDGFVSGEFVWTGFDYLGEPTPYRGKATDKGLISVEETARSSYFGIVDLCGIPKDRYYLYKSYWKPEETTVHILPHWNWEGREGTNIPVFVYTNGDEAELFLNGKSLGKQSKKSNSKKSIERYRLMWNEVKYQPGELKAVAYKDGKIIGEEMVKTAGKPYKLRLTADRNELKANGDDFSFILVEAFDKNGNICPLADNKVEFSVKGPAEIAGVGNGNPQSYEPFQTNTRKLFYGKAMLIIRTKESESGKISVVASSKGLKKSEAKLISKK